MCKGKIRHSGSMPEDSGRRYKVWSQGHVLVRKIKKIWAASDENFLSYLQKTSGGSKDPPSPNRVSLRTVPKSISLKSLSEIDVSHPSIKPNCSLLQFYNLSSQPVGVFHEPRTSDSKDMEILSECWYFQNIGFHENDIMTNDLVSACNNHSVTLTKDL